MFVFLGVCYSLEIAHREPKSRTDFVGNFSGRARAQTPPPQKLFANLTIRTALDLSSSGLRDHRARLNRCQILSRGTRSPMAKTCCWDPADKARREKLAPGHGGHGAFERKPDLQRYDVLEGDFGRTGMRTCRPGGLGAYVVGARCRPRRWELDRGHRLLDAGLGDARPRLVSLPKPIPKALNPKL